MSHGKTRTKNRDSREAGVGCAAGEKKARRKNEEKQMIKTPSTGDVRGKMTLRRKRKTPPPFFLPRNTKNHTFFLISSR